MPFQQLKISKERIPMLIGKRGTTKRKIQKLTSSTIKVNSKEGDVEIESDDGYNCLICYNIVRAISRGFNPEKAIYLAKDDYSLEIISIQDFSGASKKKMERLKSRVIGTKGKAKKTIQNITDTEICIHGKTVSIIGYAENVVIAKKAIERLSHLEKELKNSHSL